MADKIIPASVAIIMDGNGRWAKRRGLPRKMGHAEGAKRVDELVEACLQRGVKCLTLYTLSTENLKRRPADELNALMKLFIKMAGSKERKLADHGVRVTVLGERAAFDEPVRKAIERLEAFTADGTDMRLQLALNYGARDELARAFRLYGEDVRRGTAPEMDEAAISRYLYTAGAPDPDLLIRTGGEERISNFLLYQIAYSELYFTPTLWPDFDAEALDAALEEYARRNRRYGGL